MKTIWTTRGDDDAWDFLVWDGDGPSRPVPFRDSHQPTDFWCADDRSTGCFVLAMLDQVVADPQRALRLMMRTKHRVAPNWRAERGWSITEAELAAIIADIEQIERATAPARRMVALEPTPVVSDRGADIVWTKEPTLTPNSGSKP